MDRGRRWHGKGAKGSLIEQLQTMHQPLDATEEPKAHGCPPHARPGDGASVLRMMSTMARKPHWQTGKLGTCTQPGSGVPAHAGLHTKQSHSMAHSWSVHLSVWFNASQRCLLRAQTLETHESVVLWCARDAHVSAHWCCRTATAICSKGQPAERSGLAQDHGVPAGDQQTRVGAGQL